MNRPAAVPATRCQHSRTDPLGSWHAENRKPVEDVAAGHDLVALSGLISRLESSAESALVSVEGVFRSRLLMVTDIDPPSSTAHKRNVLDVGVPLRQHWFSRHHCTASRWDHRVGPELVGRLVHGSATVGSVSRDAMDRCPHLSDQVGECRGIRRRVVR